MPKLPILKPKEVINLLKKSGFRLDHITGSHYIFYHPQKHGAVSVPYHNRDLPKGTLSAILKQAGIEIENI